MSVNTFKIQQKINELNETIPGWVAINGYVALSNFEFQESILPRADGANKTPVFNPFAGVPLKAFMNISTGEIKLFAASIFES